jgi:thioredoxin 1
MATLNLTQSNFKDAIEKKDGIVLIDWWAPWCGPCRMFGPIFEKSSAKHPDIVFAKVNTEDEQELAGMFDIRSIPTLMILRDGVLLYAEAGALPEATLEDYIGKVRALDMEKVRAEIAEHERKHAEKAATR